MASKLQRGAFDEHGNVTIKEYTVITDSETGESAMSAPHTRTVQPGDDISALTGIAKEVCEKVHTPERIAKRMERKAKADQEFAKEAERKANIAALRAERGNV